MKNIFSTDVGDKSKIKSIFFSSPSTPWGDPSLPWRYLLTATWSYIYFGHRWHTSIGFEFFSIALVFPSLLRGVMSENDHTESLFLHFQSVWIVFLSERQEGQTCYLSCKHFWCGSITEFHRKTIFNKPDKIRSIYGLVFTFQFYFLEEMFPLNFILILVLSPYPIHTEGIVLSYNTCGRLKVKLMHSVASRKMI